MSGEEVLWFRQALLGWYGVHARDLPWRRTREPYRIWISEIMLQQTRVAAVIEHYGRFKERFPTVEALAAADEPEVLAYWSGLGYYRRARMMHRAARVVVAEHGGAFPRTAAGLRGLPGIGAYTAAAIASIAFAEPVAVVDGNVERVLTRVAALDRKSAEEQLSRKRAMGMLRQVQELAGTLIDPQEPSHFNQGMMELGAMVCLPRGPLCLQCPVQPVCRMRGEHVTVAKKPLVAREAFYALVRRGESGEVLLEQRPAEVSLMAGMWQLPELQGAPAGVEPVLRLKHSITVTNYTVRVFEVAGGDLEASGRGLAHGWERRWVAAGAVEKLPLTGLARKVLKRAAPLAELGMAKRG